MKYPVGTRFLSVLLGSIRTIVRCNEEGDYVIRYPHGTEYVFSEEDLSEFENGTWTRLREIAVFSIPNERSSS